MESEYQKLSERQITLLRKYDTRWTTFMQKVMDGIAEEMNCHVARIRPENKKESGEYLNIDAVFIDNAKYDLIEEYGFIEKKEWDNWDSFVLPRAVVELENSYDIKKIAYCLWKILWIRAPVRVLICYQEDKDKVKTLKQHLEDVIQRGKLVKETDGDLLVVIGDESVGDEASWGEYFTVFEWRNNRLEKIEGLE